MRGALAGYQPVPQALQTASYRAVVNRAPDSHNNASDQRSLFAVLSANGRSSQFGNLPLQVGALGGLELARRDDFRL
jgi:hypothetical protein